MIGASGLGLLAYRSDGGDNQKLDWRMAHRDRSMIADLEVCEEERVDPLGVTKRALTWLKLYYTLEPYGCNVIFATTLRTILVSGWTVARPPDFVAKKCGNRRY